jgi:hypothetical protein
MKSETPIKHIVRDAVRFAGIRKPIKNRDELIPRIMQVNASCLDVKRGPLTHILRFDTPVDGFDSEIGYPVCKDVNTGGIQTHTLRRLHFFSLTHRGPLSNLRETTIELINHLNKVGLASELEIAEIFHVFDPDNQEDNVIDVMVSFLAWPEIYREQLLRVLGSEKTEDIWSGGDAITPFTLVDDRAAWVASSLERLKKFSDEDQQFDILSRVALERPAEDIQKYKKLFEETGSVNGILEIQNDQLKSGPSGGFIDPPRYDGNILHLSKVAYNREAYNAAGTREEIRKAYCFCTLIREAKNPRVDPIFCYRAAGWARQFWEPILGINFKSCRITHSILKGDDFCAWDFVLD